MEIALPVPESRLFIKIEIMRTLFYVFVLLGMGMLLGSAAKGQTPQKEPVQPPQKQITQTQKKRTEMKDLRGDVRDHKVATHQVNKDLGHVRISKAIKDHKAVHQINKEETADAKRLEAQGVDHPVAKAKRQVKVQDDNRKDHTQ
jgi:hypothetical protein